MTRDTSTSGDRIANFLDQLEARMAHAREAVQLGVTVQGVLDEAPRVLLERYHDELGATPAPDLLRVDHSKCAS